MKIIPDWLRNGYQRMTMPIARSLAAAGVTPNTITIVGTCFWILGGMMYAAGWLHAGGWLLGVTALFDVIDGQVARLSQRESQFGAFLDSTLDRVADGAVLGGLGVFFASGRGGANVAMVALCFACLLGTVLVSYTRARAESIGVSAKVGLMQRPERVVLLSAPQAFFGFAFDGLFLSLIILFLTISAWTTVIQRVLVVRRAG